MDAPQFQVLVVNNEPATSQHIATLLPPQRFRTQIVNNGCDCLKMVQSNEKSPDLILIGADLAATRGFSVIRDLRSISADLSIAITGNLPSRSHTMEAQQYGVRDFLQEPILQPELQAVVNRVGKASEAVATIPNQPYIENLSDGQFFLAVSPAMRAIHRQVCTLSKVDVPVLITGESGVGKEIIAQLLHRNSLRAGRQLLKVNCAALPVDLLESELFGYEAGAFTGAMKSKPGKFEQCDGGTILLDEIGEMSPQLQAKLLHVLQDGTFSRLGARVNSKVNVRVIAATNVNIEEAIIERRFREDLYYRLNAFVIQVPSLRERREEIPYFLNELGSRFAIANHLEPLSFSAELIAAAVQYSWPGNLRELGNFVKRYLITRDADSALVELESKIAPRTKPASHFPLNVESACTSNPGLKSVIRTMKDQTESRMILEVLDQTKWNRRIAAEQLQISYKALLYKIRLYNLQASA